MLQRPAVSSAALDAIAVEIGGVGLSLQHRWPILGNHDANVVSCAITRLPPQDRRGGLEISYWDARRPIDELVARAHGEWEASLIGLIVNVPRRSAFSLFLMPGRHWYAIRRATSTRWVDLDSLRERPELLEDGQLCARLRAEVEKGAHVLVVRSDEK